MRNPSQDAPFRLLTIPTSHFCEKARWALDRLNLSYEEEGHAPIFHYPSALRATWRQGVSRTVPVLISRAGVFSDSTAILAYLDEFLPPDAALYPEDPALRKEVEAWEERFDSRLGPATRLWAYYHLLPSRALALRLLQGRIHPLEHATLRAIFPAARLTMMRGMKITPARAERAIQKTREIFSSVDEALSDGRRYLVGGRFSAADLTFAALAAPVLLPPETRSPLPTLDEVPEAMREEVLALRARPAGQYALRLFREERQKRVNLAQAS